MIVLRLYRRQIYFALALGLFVSSCKKTTTTETVTTTSLGSESYVVVNEGVIESGPTISGTLVPRNQAIVRAQIAGSVLRTFFVQGQNVVSGQLLAQIDNRSLADAVTSARLAVMNAESALQLAHKEEERQTALVKAGAIAQRDVDQTRKNVISGEAGVSQARAMLSSAEKQLSNASVFAPFSGTISEKSVAMGDVVQPGAAMYTVVDPTTLELQGTIPADALGMVHVGLPIKFNVTGYPNQAFTGTLTRINPTADPSTRQVRIYAEIPNVGKNLVGGLYAEGRIASILKTAISIPADAVDHRMITPAVERLHNGVVERVVVALGTMDEKNNIVQITSGVNAGDTILRGSAMAITLGSHVKTIDSAQPANAQPVAAPNAAAATTTTTRTSEGK